LKFIAFDMFFCRIICPKTLNAQGLTLNARCISTFVFACSL
jgi:hypothetical protein